MSLITEPALVLPEYTISQERMIEVLEEQHPYHPKWSMVKKMIKNTNVENRHLLLPIEQTMVHPGFEFRNNLYKEKGLKMAMDATQQALDKAQLTAQDIDMIIVVSCTGFLMPSLTSYLISNMDFKTSTKQLPVSQLGCAAGSWAINRAFEYTNAFKDQNVLLVSVEFSSLLYQPEDYTVSALISKTLFGDAVTACVIKGEPKAGDKGYWIEGITNYLKKDTQHYIKYDVKSTGFHFDLDKEVMHSIKDVAPIMKEFVQDKFDKKVNELDFFVFHTGGRKILDELVSNLELNEEGVSLSRKSLRNRGNIASGVVLDVLFEEFNSKKRKHGETGMMAAFGPGFTAEINLGTWLLY